jgi:hypothetical protein
MTAEPPRLPRLAPLPEPDPPMSIRKKLLIALAITLALTGVVSIGWWIAQPEAEPSLPCCEASETVNDTAAGVMYTVPQEWRIFEQGEYVDVFTSGAGIGDETSGAQIWVFHDEIPVDDLRASAERIAGVQTGFFYAAVPETNDVLASEPTTIGGNDAYEIEWVANHEQYDHPLYGRLVQIGSADGLASAYVFGFAYPDSEAMREQIDWVFASIGLA